MGQDASTDQVVSVEDYLIPSNQVVRGERLGRGGFGTVYKGEMRTGLFRQQVAIKRILVVLPEHPNPQSLSGAVPRAKIEREIHIMADIDHPNVLRCFGGFYDDPDRPHELKANIVMEFCEGGDLDRWLHSPRVRNHHSLPLLLRVSTEIAEGLYHLHSKGVIHHDLSKDNVLVTSLGLDGEMKLCDFGLSRHDFTISSRHHVGKYQYMPPVFSKDSQVDVYAYGILLWEIWSSQRAYEDLFRRGIHGEDLRDRVKGGLRPDLAELANTPEEIVELIEECWIDEASQRPTMREVVRILKSLRGDRWSGRVSSDEVIHTGIRHTHAGFSVNYDINSSNKALTEETPLFDSPTSMNQDENVIADDCCPGFADCCSLEFVIGAEAADCCWETMYSSTSECLRSSCDNIGVCCSPRGSRYGCIGTLFLRVGGLFCWTTSNGICERCIDPDEDDDDASCRCMRCLELWGCRLFGPIGFLVLMFSLTLVSFSEYGITQCPKEQLWVIWIVSLATMGGVQVLSFLFMFLLDSCSRDFRSDDIEEETRETRYLCILIYQCAWSILSLIVVCTVLILYCISLAKMNQICDSDTFGFTSPLTLYGPVVGLVGSCVLTVCGMIVDCGVKYHLTSLLGHIVSGFFELVC